MYKRIEQIFTASGLSQTRIAERLKVSRSFVSQMCRGVKIPSDRTISGICQEFNVNEHWLRTGEGEMFIAQTREDEISAFMGDLLRCEPDFRHRLIAVLAKLTPDEWELLEAIARRLNDEQ